jgi:hypothetical protein
VGKINHVDEESAVPRNLNFIQFQFACPPENTLIHIIHSETFKCVIIYSYFSKKPQPNKTEVYFGQYVTFINFIFTFVLVTFKQFK